MIKNSINNLHYMIKRYYITILGCSGITGFVFFLYYISRINYLLFHTLAETFSIVVACVIFTIAWNLRDRITNNYIMFVGFAYLFKSIFQVLHMLAYKGINIFTSYPGANLATQLWIVTRYTISVSLFIAPFFIGRKLNKPLIFFVYSAFTVMTLLSIFVWGIFPVCYAEPGGLTLFKILSEHIISFIFALSIIALILKKKHFDKKVLNLIITAIALKIAAEMIFTAYLSVYGFLNFLGHIIAFVSSCLIYSALISIGLKNPLGLIFRDLQDKTTEYAKEIEFIRAVIDTAGVLVVVYNADGRIVLVNRTFQELTGYTADAIKDRPYWDLFIKKDEADRVKNIFYKIKSGGHHERHSNYWIMKDSSLRLISWSTSVLRDRKNNKEYLVGVGSDITQVTNLELENKNIISMIAHDMKSPLLSVQLFSGHLIRKKSKLTPKKKEEYLNIIHREGEKLNMLIDEFMEFLLMNRGLISLEHEPFDPDEVLNHIYEVYRVKAEENEIMINLFNSYKGKITGDSKRLNRAITNLLDNAIKFSDKKTVIDINSYKKDGSLVIEIKDRGAGIPEDDLQQIFTPFMRGSKSVGKAGYGIGLAYVKSVVEKHDGNIFVESEPGEGTKFTIQLPLCR